MQTDSYSAQFIIQIQTMLNDLHYFNTMIPVFGASLSEGIHYLNLQGGYIGNYSILFYIIHIWNKCFRSVGWMSDTSLVSK